VVDDLLRTVRPAVFVGSSRRDLQACPNRGQAGIGQALFEVQLGLHPRQAKSLKGFGRVFEIRDNFGGDAYRAVYTVRFDDAVYVLHVFQKKSASGIATPQRHLDLIKRRLREAIRIHEAKKEGRA
jgi:phage-related protein